jgi:hypothetical protein
MLAVAEDSIACSTLAVNVTGEGKIINVSEAKLLDTTSGDNKTLPGSTVTTAVAALTAKTPTTQVAPPVSSAAGVQSAAPATTGGEIANTPVIAAVVKSRLLTKLGTIIANSPGETTTLAAFSVEDSVPGAQTTTPLASKTVVLSNPPEHSGTVSPIVLVSVISLVALAACSTDGCNANKLATFVVTAANVAACEDAVSVIVPMLSDTE